jgi:hypothetical protein
LENNPPLSPARGSKAGCCGVGRGMRPLSERRGCELPGARSYSRSPVRGGWQRGGARSPAGCRCRRLRRLSGCRGAAPRLQARGECDGERPPFLGTVDQRALAVAGCRWTGMKHGIGRSMGLGFRRRLAAPAAVERRSPSRRAVLGGPCRLRARSAGFPSHPPTAESNPRRRSNFRWGEWPPADSRRTASRRLRPDACAFLPDGHRQRLAGDGAGRGLRARALLGGRSRLAMRRSEVAPM